uniref:Uncharacterized protein n=1 Tax=Rhipicephalus zambeziensis TaxID=60191 RepID=A0A224Y511_9ACAR
MVETCFFQTHWFRILMASQHLHTSSCLVGELLITFYSYLRGHIPDAQELSTRVGCIPIIMSRLIRSAVCEAKLQQCRKRFSRQWPISGAFLPYFFR